MHEPSAPVLEPYLQDSDFTLYNSDAREALAELPDESVHMCVTSPPFFGLRDYGVAGQIGLEATPEEWVAQLVAVFEEVRRVLRKDGTLWVECGDSYTSGGRDTHGPSKPDKNMVLHNAKRAPQPPGLKPKDLIGQPFLLAFALREAGWCWRNCNVWSKPNPMPESVTDRFTVAHSNVLLFSKCTWTGCVEPIYLSERNAAWLAAFVDGEGTISIGATSGGGYQVLLSVCNTNREVLERIAQITGMGSVNKSKMGTNRPVYRWEVGSRKAAQILYRIHPHLIIKQQQAWTALALQETHKRYGDNGRPKATTEKQEALLRTIRALNRGEEVGVPPPKARWRVNPYFFDAEAVREDHSGRASGNKERFIPPEGHSIPNDHMGRSVPWMPTVAPDPDVQTLDGSEGEAARGPDGRRKTGRDLPVENSHENHKGMGERERWPNSGRNARSVWTIPTKPLADAHYAAFPETLAERCIKAGTSERGCCPDCRAPWKRIVESETIPARENWSADETVPRNDKDRAGGFYPTVTESGWRPSCRCGHEYGPDGEYGGGGPRIPIPCTVFDPFLGSGTTALVARRLGRHCIGSELSETYCELIARRTQQLSLMAE